MDTPKGVPTPVFMYFRSFMIYGSIYLYMPWILSTANIDNIIDYLPKQYTFYLWNLLFLFHLTNWFIIELSKQTNKLKNIINKQNVTVTY